MIRPRRSGWPSSLLAGIGLCAVAVGQGLESASVDVFVTAVARDSKVHFDDVVAVGRPPDSTFRYNAPEAGEAPDPAVNSPPLSVKIVRAAARDSDREPAPTITDAAMLYAPDEKFSLLLRSTQAELRLRPDDKQPPTSLVMYFNVRADAAGDFLDVYRSGPGRSLYIEFLDARSNVSVVVKVMGSGRLAAAPGGVEIRVADGSFVVMPSGAAVDTLDAGGDNAATVTAGGLGPRRRDATIASEMAAARGGLIQSSLLTAFASIAEETAEGDLEPPGRGSPVVGGTTLVFARVTDIVPRGAGFASLALAASSATNAVGAAPSTAEAFLASGNAALALVGARLQSTRVVADPAGGGLSINAQLGRRFTLGAR